MAAVEIAWGVFLLAAVSLACQQDEPATNQEAPPPSQAAFEDAPAIDTTALEPGATKEFGGIEFAWIPPGAYEQGSSEPPEMTALRFYGVPEWYSDEWPRQTRRFSEGFWMSKTEITLGQWIDVIGKPPGRAVGSVDELDMPVAQVTWQDARNFAEAKSRALGGGTCRLPTEAEWEYACRAGSDTAFFFGDEPSDLPEYAWCRATAADGAPRPVAGLAANPWGLQDILGNVWEWTADAYRLYDAEDGRQAPGYRVIRGGAANSTAPYLRAAFRVGVSEETRNDRLGFRVVYVP